MIDRLDNLTVLECPALKAAVVRGICHYICKFYSTDKEGEHCDYAKWIRPEIPLVTAAKQRSPAALKPRKKVHEIVRVL
jgi:hypothetical protein